jgi:hypothetical protein
MSTTGELGEQRKQVVDIRLGIGPARIRAWPLKALPLFLPLSNPCYLRIVY